MTDKNLGCNEDMHEVAHILEEENFKELQKMADEITASVEKTRENVKEISKLLGFGGDN